MRMWKKDLPIFPPPCRTSQPSWRTAAGAGPGPGPAEAPLDSSPLRDIPVAAGVRGSSMLRGGDEGGRRTEARGGDGGGRRTAGGGTPWWTRRRGPAGGATPDLGEGERKG
ncbi:hypothetical protein PVAP13_8NG244900 [Panicum virgatum]|uniref:Uncharacterized protein n=1 Tax=Panicum virgatum TaxID=38727 RepID=A0A8T0P7X5_PANVG|nr:hypothetical protein PVAP13_8NG244900 [Panicum virgatum]